MATAIMTTTTAITTTTTTTMESILENGGGAPEEGGRVLGNRETTTSSNHNIERQKTACLVMSCIGLVIGASVYTFPTFTKSLLEQGLVDADVTVLGAVTQFSMAVGVVTRSILESYNINDMILAGGFTFLEAIACFMISIVSNVPTSAPINANKRFGIYLISWIMIGAGLGGQFNHALLLQKTHYALEPKKRSTSLSTVCFSIGFGALIWAVVIPYVNHRYGMSISFLFQGGALLLSLLRLPWQSRIVVDLSTPESTTTTTTTTTAISTTDRKEEEERREPTNFWIVIKDCVRDIPAMLIFITAFLNFGVSATMLSMLGVLAPYYTTSNVDGDAAVQLITANVTLTFLCCQCASRGIIAKISWQKHVRQFSLVGIALLGVMGSLVGLLSSPSSSASFVSTTTTATPLYVASALFGILFGWCWTILPVHVITFFPHQPHRYDVAFGAFALWAASLGTIAVTISSNFVVEAGSSGHDSLTSKDSLFVFFLSISGVSLLLGIISIGYLKEKQN